MSKTRSIARSSTAKRCDYECRSGGAIWHGDQDGAPLKEWLVDEMLPRTGLALIAGQWGTYKTFVMLDLSASVMTKAQFAGREVHRQGGVLLLAAEGQSEVRLRVEGVARERVAAFRPAEDVIPIDPEHMPFVWRKSCPRLADPRTLDELRKIVAAAASGMKERFGLPLALVLIDALTTAAQFRDADDTAENQRALNLTVSQVGALATRTTRQAPGDVAGQLNADGCD